MILHIDMDAFFASIEQAINPKLKGRPVIVGSRGEIMRTVVCAASYEAKALGITSGMASHEALRICPQAVFVTADQSKYIWTSRQIRAMLKTYGFKTLCASIDEFQMDIDTADAMPIAQDIQRKITARFHITASIGGANNWLLAKLASKLKKPNGIVIITNNNLYEILDKTPVEKLCGVGMSTTRTLHELSVFTCLDLYQKPARFLEKYLRQHGLNLYWGLRAIDHFDTEEEESEAKSIGHSYTLPRPSKNADYIRAWLRLLSDMVAERMRKNNVSGRTIHLWLNGPEIGNSSAQKTFSQPTFEGYEITQRCIKIMDQIFAQKSLEIPRIRALGISTSNFEAMNYGPLLKEQEKTQNIIKSVDAINNRFGERTIFPAIVNAIKKGA